MRAGREAIKRAGLELAADVISRRSWTWAGHVVRMPVAEWAHFTTMCFSLEWHLSRVLRRKPVQATRGHQRRWEEKFQMYCDQIAQQETGANSDNDNNNNNNNNNNKHDSDNNYRGNMLVTSTFLLCHLNRVHRQQSKTHVQERTHNDTRIWTTKLQSPRHKARRHNHTQQTSGLVYQRL